jgi:hypothetical protein
MTKRREEAWRCDEQQQRHVKTANDMTSRPLVPMTTVTTMAKWQYGVLRQDKRRRQRVKPTMSMSRPTMEQWEEARRRDKQWWQLIEIADNVNIKNNNDEGDDDDDEVAGGGTAAGQTMTTTHRADNVNVKTDDGAARGGLAAWRMTETTRQNRQRHQCQDRRWQLQWWRRVKTSGTDVSGHRNMKAMVCAMRSSTRRPLPDMFRKIFGQWEQSFSP